MFIDRAQINIKGGNGGDGAVSFYRAKYITHGGPDGGDGGRGGSVIFKADRGITTLMDFRYKRKFAANQGDNGGKRNCSGKDANDIIVRVPVGTIIREANSNKIMADMSVDGEEKVLIKGGKGGRGNQHFATSTRQAPRYSEPGRQSKEYDVILELKLVADVGLIGFPNVGKSTILSMVTNANPKIANYHFTTLTPNLGVVRSKYGEDFVLADIPGLIEGASEGLGLGLEFLRHVERTKVFIHVVDVSGLEGNDPFESIEKINNEIGTYKEELLKRPQIIAANKMDIPEAQENYEILKLKCENLGYKIFPVSAYTNQGLNELIDYAFETLKEYPETIIFEEDYDPFEDAVIDTEPITVTKGDDGIFYVEGPSVARMLGYTNLDVEKGFAFFQKYLREKGIIEELVKLGISEGDTVKLYDLEFDYYG